MKTIRFFLLAAITGSLSLSVMAQQTIQVPVDTAIHTGRLSNGLTYFIRHNGEPKERASFYIIQNVGSILEEDDQNGLAHFLEHMAFNGTQNFPGKGIINTLEKHGVAFGQNINAYTSYDETIYNLTDVPVNAPGIVDTCLLILHDWSHFLSLTDSEIDLERGVVSEEWRTRRNAAFRMQKAIQQVMFKGSRYADRDIIGDIGIIKSFKYETLRDFYHRWYRPDLQAIAVVGDIDVNRVEAKIRELFGPIPAVVNPVPRPVIEIPEHKETYYVKATDPEATNYSVAVFSLIRGVAPERKDMAYYRDQLAINLVNRIVSDRIRELLQKGQPPFIQGYIMFGKFVRGYDRMMISATAKPNKLDEALRAIYTEAQRLNRYGITRSELERAKLNMITQTETQWKQKDKINNDQYADAISDHFLENEPLESMDTQWELTQQLLPGITAEELNMKVRKWLTAGNRIIAVMGPEGKDVKLLEETEALNIMDEVGRSEIKPYEDSATGVSLIDRELKGSPIISTRELPDFHAVEWTLGNNARVVYRFADFQKDNILFQGISPGGVSLYGPDMLPSAMMIPEFTSNFGAGKYDAIALRKMLTGKNVNLRPELGELNEAFSGASAVKDFETMLQLLYLKFQEPRFDKEAFEALKTRYIALIKNMEKNPQKIMSDSLQLILTCHNPRTILVTPSFFDKVTLDNMEKIYRDRFSDAGDFTFFIVGNVADTVARRLAEKYVGSLTDLPRTENWVDNNEKFPEGKTVREIRIPLQTKKATVIIAYDHKLPWTPEDNMKLDVIRDLLNLRYTDVIREKEGGTYSVNVATQSDKFPKEDKSLQLNFDTDTARAASLKPLIYREIEKLQESGPTPEDLGKVVQNLLKDREQSKPNNGYWMNMLTGYYRYNVNYDRPENFENILKALTVKDVQKYAKKFFDKADLVDIVFKPKE